MFLLNEFWTDLGRFRQKGLLPVLLRLLFVRIELAFWAAVVIGLAIYLFVKKDFVSLAAMTLLIVILVHILFVGFVVRILSPLYFGQLVTSQLTNSVQWRRFALTVLTFAPRSSSGRSYFTSTGLGFVKGVQGETYLLALHPSNRELVLPLLDDNPHFFTYVLGLADKQRAEEIRQRVSRLRGVEIQSGNKF